MKIRIKNNFNESLKEFTIYIEKDQANDFYNKKDWFKGAFYKIENKNKIQPKKNSYEHFTPMYILKSIFDLIPYYFSNLFSSNKEENPRGNFDFQSSEQSSVKDVI